jgi:hypothetical protein
MSDGLISDGLIDPRFSLGNTDAFCTYRTHDHDLAGQPSHG